MDRQELIKEYVKKWSEVPISEIETVLDIASIILDSRIVSNAQRGEAVRTGQAKARLQGKKWGGTLPGVPKKVKDPEVRHCIVQMYINGNQIAKIARHFNISRPTVYSILRQSGCPLQSKC